MVSNLSVDAALRLKTSLTKQENGPPERCKLHFNTSVLFNTSSPWQPPDLSFLAGLSTDIDTVHAFSMAYNGESLSQSKEDGKRNNKKHTVIIFSN